MYNVDCIQYAVPFGALFFVRYVVLRFYDSLFTLKMTKTEILPKIYLHGVSVSTKSDHRFAFSTLFEARLLIQIFSNISTYWNISIPRYREVKKSHFNEI